MYGQIYKITNLITNKIYIGQTVKQLSERLHEHIIFAKSGANTKLARSIIKHGENNFIIEKIDEAISKDELDKKEIYWIAYYNSIETGYNMTIGGDGGNTYQKRSQEQMIATRAKIAKKAHEHNSNHGQYVGEKNAMYGKHHTDEAKKAMHDKLIGRKKPKDHGKHVSKATKGKPKNYFSACKYLYLIEENIIKKLQVRELLKLFGISATELTAAVKEHKLVLNKYNVVECVSTNSDECNCVGLEISTSSKE